MSSKWTPLQNDFSKGELSPRLSARSDLDMYAGGLEELTNILPLRQGPAIRREGTKHTETYDLDTSGELFTFHISPSQSFAISITDDGLLRVNDGSGQTLDEQLVDNPFFDEGLTDWSDNSEPLAGVIWANGVVGLTSNQVGREARLGQAIDTSGAPDDIHVLRVIGAGPLDSRLTIRVGTGLNDNSLGEFVILEGVDTIQFDPAGNNQVWVTLVYIGVGDLTGLWSLDTVTCGALSAGGVEFGHPWNADDINDMQASMPPGEDTMFFSCPREAPQELLYDAATHVWTFQPVTFIGIPAAWFGSNFPAAITFFQGRSWWGGTPNEPATFWASKSNIIRDMTVEDPDIPVADDALEFNLSRRGRIEWMEGVKNLLIGTENAEFIVTAEKNVIEPGDIVVEQQSAFGSENAQALPIGNSVLYLSADGAKLREINYSWTENGWLSRELTWAAEHMGTESPMRKVVYVKDPESIIACLTAAGEIYACTYDGDNKAQGWCRINTAGRVVAITVTQERGTSTLWWLVDRELGTDVAELEKSTVTGINRDFLDSHVIQFNETPTDVVAPVLHLAGQTVSVVVDNATHPDILLDEFGAGTLNFDGTRVVVGQKFRALLRTLPFTRATQGGSTAGRAKRWPRVIVRIISSVMPLINGQRPPERFPATPMDTTEPDRSIDVDIRQLGWERDGQIEIEMDAARDLQVTGIFGEFVEGFLSEE